MMLPNEPGPQTRLSGDPDAIRPAEEAHERHTQLVLRPDRMMLPSTIGDLA